MPSFPTTPRSFATKFTGDTIEAEHVNALQDEVNALESGYLNATARLNSSNSTLVALSVTGGSTLQSLNSSNSTVANLSVTGGTTLAGAFQSSASTLASLVVSGGSTLGTVQAGASTLASLSVTGGSTFTTLQATNSTFSNLSVSSNSTIAGGLVVSGGSTLGTVQAGASTLASLVVTGGSTFAGRVTLIGNLAATQVALQVTSSLSPGAGNDVSIVHVLGTIQEAGSGTHPVIAGLRITAPTIFSGGSSVTETTTLYIS